METLSTEAIPYALDGDELFVASEDEARVDEILGALTTPGATLTLGGPASFEAMSELFVAADVLSKDPDDRHATASLIEGARAAAGSDASRTASTRGGGTAWWPAPARWPTSSSRTNPTTSR